MRRLLNELHELMVAYGSHVVVIVLVVVLVVTVVVNGTLYIPCPHPCCAAPTLIRVLAVLGVPRTGMRKKPEHVFVRTCF